MEPAVYKNFKFGSIQVKYLYQGSTLVWPPSEEDYTFIPHSYDGGSVDGSGNWIGGGGPVEYHYGYSFAGFYYRPSSISVGTAVYKDKTRGLMIHRNSNTTTLEGGVGAEGTVWEDYPNDYISPGLMVKTIDSSSYSNAGITPQTTESSDSATESIRLSGLFRKMSWKSDGNFLDKVGHSGDPIPSGSLNAFYYEDEYGNPVYPTEFVFPKWVEVIGDGLFYNNTALETVTYESKMGLSRDIDSIPDYCFTWCTSLTKHDPDSSSNVNISSSIEYIGIEAFAHTGISELTLNGYVSIGARAFEGCTRLVYIKSKVQIPPDSNAAAFNNVHQNGVIDIPSVNQLTRWVYWAGKQGLLTQGWTIECNGQTVWDIPVTGNSVLYKTSDHAEVFPNEADYSYRRIVSHYYSNVADMGVLNYEVGVTGLQDQSFMNRTTLIDIILPPEFTSIGQGVFYNCTGLQTFTIPSTVTTVGGSLFDRCSNLHTVTFEAPSHVTEIPNNMFNNSGLTSMDLPASITKIHGTPWTGIHKLDYIRFEGTTPPVLTDYTGEPNTPEYSAFYDTWWWKDGVQYFPPIYVPNVNTYKNSSTEWYYWWEQGRVVQG